MGLDGGRVFKTWPVRGVAAGGAVGSVLLTDLLISSSFSA